MIRYSLKCSIGHSFDSWFASGEAFEKLVGAGSVCCAVCGDTDIQKAIMAPRVLTGGQPEDESPPSLRGPASPAEQALAEIRRKIEAHSENVGRRFAEEARAIHEGLAPKRSIYGEARIEEAKALIEEGVPVAPLPWSSRRCN
ncbi:MAG: DUF1178 family protein [Paracoccaceae bacterium]